MPIFLTVEIKEKSVQVKFNDIKNSDDVKAHCVDFKRSDILEIWHYLEGFVTVVMSNGKKWDLNLDGSNGAYPVTTVDIGDSNGAQIPTGLENLKDLLDNIFL